MAILKCAYCGREYDEFYEGHLDNGSDCCPQCERDEEMREKQKAETKENPE